MVDKQESNEYENYAVAPTQMSRIHCNWCFFFFFRFAFNIESKSLSRTFKFTYDLKEFRIFIKTKD